MSVTRRPACLFGFAIALLSLSSDWVTVASARTRRRRPNILLLLTDDQDVALGSFDHVPQTRKWLMEQGTVFENAYVHTPICCPSRSSILTGRYLHNGAALNNSLSGHCYDGHWRKFVEPYTFAVHAQQAGYRTAYAGKYLNAYGTKQATGDSPLVPPGWDHWFGLVGNSRYYNESIVVSDDGGTTVQVKHYHDRYPDDYLPDVLKNYILDVLNTFQQQDDDDDRPWLMVLAWPTPHGPFTPAPWAEGKFDGIKAPRSRNFNASAVYQQQKHWLLRNLHPLDSAVTAEIDGIYQSRLEALLSVDEHVGELMTALQAYGVLEFTVTVYTSDHGFQFGQHRLAIDKRHLYEHDLKIPFVVRGPGIARNASNKNLVLNIDIAPTIYDIVYNYQHDADASRHPLPPYMDGLSFWSHLTSRNAAVMEQDDPFSARTDFLVSYHGEGDKQCGLANCPMPQPPEVWHMPDSFNNTYHCVRTLSRNDNSIFCQFQDNDYFIEYYNLTSNPWQLDNDFDKLSIKQVRRYVHRLGELRTCRGSTCNTPGIESRGTRGIATESAL